MSDYYRYLWSTTWPDLIVLLLIWVCVCFRFYWKLKMTWRYARDAWGFIVLTAQALVWVAVLGIYTNLLFFSQPDWLAKPGFMQGTLVEKAYNAGTKVYILEVRSGTDQKKFYVDRNVYDQLNVQDQVKLMYLPIRKEVVRCEVF